MIEGTIAALRRIMRALDLQSRKLARSHGLTGPQALLLKEISLSGSITVGELAERASLSQATVTDILLRLEKRGLVIRQRSSADKRCVLVTATATGKSLIAGPLPLLRQRFVDEFQQLREWEQTQLLASLQRIADMMSREETVATREESSRPAVQSDQAVH
jgi:DNA-binding MarR family transcriptional regulator